MTTRAIEIRTIRLHGKTWEIINWVYYQAFGGMYASDICMEEGVRT
jgi:hypothetical protein